METVVRGIQMTEALILMGLYFLCYCFTRNSAKETISDIGYNSKFYPYHYTLPPKWLRKHFGLKKSMIPKFLCARLYLALAWGGLVPITALICLIAQCNKVVVGFLLVFPCAFTILDTIIFTIVSYIYKK